MCRPLLLLLGLLTLPGVSGTYAAAVDAEQQTITLALLQDPPNLNSSLTTDLVSFFVLGHVQEGLVRYDRRGGVAPGVASRWEISPRQLIFELNPAARWSDGSQVTAHDFVFSWRLLNDPATAAPYSAIMYPIVNAERIQKGELPVTALGVRAEGPSKLIVDLARPCAFCLKLMVHAAFMPIKETFYRAQAGQYGGSPAQLLYNGPFVLASWTHGRDLMLVRNPAYWNNALTRLNGIHVGYITEDNRTRLNLFKDGRIALVRLGTETVKEALEAGLRLRTFLSGGVSFMRFNLREGRATADINLRQAITALMDGEEFVNRVIAVPGYKPAGSLFPTWLPEVGEIPALRPDLATARRHLAAHNKTSGPGAALTLLTTSSPTGLRIAEYFQGLWKQNLGLDVKVDQQTFKQYLEKSRRGEFDVIVSSWYPDFDDVMTFADLLASWNPNNRGRYASAEYDEKVRLLQSAVEETQRVQAIEVLVRLIARDVPILPLAETGSAFVQHARLRGVVRRAVGPDPDYSGAWVVKSR